MSARDDAAAVRRSTTGDPPPRAVLDQPHVRLIDTVDGDLVQSLIEQLAKVDESADPIAIEISTAGGDADMGRRLVLEVELARKRLAPRRLVFVGKTHVYSAGVTLMSAFPREDRFLTRDAVLLIHCRQLDQTVEISGPMRASLPKLRALCCQMELGIELEKAGFERLIAGSDIELGELLDKALHNWYLTAEEAAEHGLVAGVLEP